MNLDSSSSTNRKPNRPQSLARWWRISPWFWGTVVLGTLVFLNWPQRMVWMSQFRNSFAFQQPTSFETAAGWPWTMYENEDLWPSRPPEDKQYVQRFFPGACIANAAVLIGAPIFVVTIGRWRRRRSLTWQLSLSDLLLAMSIVSVAIGWWSNERRRALREGEFRIDSSWDTSPDLRVPIWMSLWFRQLDVQKWSRPAL